MITVDKGNVKINGGLVQVSAEAMLIFKEIYKKNKELHGGTIAKLVMWKMFDDAISKLQGEDEELAYTD